MKSRIKSFGCSFLHRTGLSALMPRLATPDLVIFNYHRIKQERHHCAFDDDLFGPSVQVFRAQMEWLSQRFRILSEENLLDILDGKTPLRRQSVMVTFDDGYRDNYDLAYPILRELGIPAIFFIPVGPINERTVGWWDQIAYLIKHSPRKDFSFDGNTYSLGHDRTEVFRKIILKVKEGVTMNGEWLGRLSDATDSSLPTPEMQEQELMTWDQIREVSANGITIGSHAVSHRILSSLNLQTQEQELRESKRILEEKLDRSVRILAYPVGGYEHFHLETQKLAEKVGYQVAFSFLTGTNPAGTFERFNIHRTYVPNSIPEFTTGLAIPRILMKSRYAINSPGSYPGP